MQNDWYEVSNDDASNTYIQYFQDQNTQLHQDIVRLKFALCERDNIISELRRTIDNYRTANEDLTQQIAKLNSTIDDLKQTIHHGNEEYWFNGGT